MSLILGNSSLPGSPAHSCSKTDKCIISSHCYKASFAFQAPRTPTLGRKGGVNVIVLLVGKLRWRNIKEDAQGPRANEQQNLDAISGVTGSQPVLSGSCSFSLPILIIKARAKASARSAGLLPPAFTAFLSSTHVLIWINTAFNSCPYLLFVVSRTVGKSQRTHTPWWLSTTATWGSNVLSSL